MEIRLAFACLAVALIACKSEPPPAPAKTCRYELRDGRGVYTVEGTLAAGTTEAQLEKKLRAEACDKRCAAEKAAGREEKGCPARCEVDLVADKLGGRLTCGG